MRVAGRPRLLFLNNQGLGAMGGGVTILRHLVDDLGADWDVTVAACDAEPAADVSAIGIPPAPGPGRLWRVAPLLRARHLARVLPEDAVRAADLVVVLDCHFAGALRRVRPARMIYLSLSCIPRQEWAAASGVQAAVNAAQYAWLERRIARDADAVVVASARHAADLRTYERLGSLDPHVLHPVFPPRRAAGPVPVADGAVTIVAAGRLEPGKNFAAVIELAGRLRDLPCRFVIAGDGPAMADLRAAAASAGVGDTVAFPGVVADMASLLDQADIFIHPSRYESFGIAPFEAMRAGLPVLCARTLGCAEIMRDGLDAVMVDFADLDATASVLRGLIADGSARGRIGAAARQTALATLQNDYVAGFRRVVDRVMVPA